MNADAKKLNLVEAYHYGLIKPNKPLLCPLYDVEGRLLANQGTVLDAEQAVTILQYGKLLTPESKLMEAVRHINSVNNKEDEQYVRYHFPTSLQQIKDVGRELTDILIGDDNDKAKSILKLAEKITRLCHAKSDALIASLFIEGRKGTFVHHAIACAVLAELCAVQLEWDIEERMPLVAAALTMDAFLFINNKPHLSETKHPEESAEMLDQWGVDDQKWLTYVRQHHEQVDGSGFPNGLKDRELKWGSVILTALNSYCESVFGYSGEELKTPKHAISILFNQREHPLFFMVAEVLLRIVGFFPIGTMVKLKNGETGLVVSNGQHVDSPNVKALIDKDGDWWKMPATRNTSSPLYTVDKEIHIDMLMFNIDFSQFWR